MLLCQLFLIFTSANQNLLNKVSISLSFTINTDFFESIKISMCALVIKSLFDLLGLIKSMLSALICANQYYISIKAPADFTLFGFYFYPCSCCITNGFCFAFFKYYLGFLEIKSISFSNHDFFTSFFFLLLSIFLNNH